MAQPGPPSPKRPCRAAPAFYARRGHLLRLAFLLFCYALPVLTSLPAMEAFTPGPSNVRLVCGDGGGGGMEGRVWWWLGVCVWGGRGGMDVDGVSPAHPSLHCLPRHSHPPRPPTSPLFSLTAAAADPPAWSLP